MGEVTKNLLRKKENIISGESELKILINKAIDENKKAVEDYRSGKTEALSAIMGTVMGISKGKADPKKTLQLLKRFLS